MPKGVWNWKPPARCYKRSIALQAELASRTDAREDEGMEIPGRVQNGVVLLEGAPALPVGAHVTVCYHGSIVSRPEPNKRRIEVPLVRTGQPGSVTLTG